VNAHLASTPALGVRSAPAPTVAVDCMDGRTESLCPDDFALVAVG
jgi:hypothetical protein